MSEPVKKNVRVIGAQYSHEAKSIALAVESEDGQFMTQVPISTLVPNITNINAFSEEQMMTATKEFCEQIVGKRINVVFDVDLNEKLKYNCKLDY